LIRARTRQCRRVLCLPHRLLIRKFTTRAYKTFEAYFVERNRLRLDKSGSFTDSLHKTIFNIKPSALLASNNDSETRLELLAKMWAEHHHRFDAPVTVETTLGPPTSKHRCNGITTLLDYHSHIGRSSAYFSRGMEKILL
jgi:hypothetical protein